MTEPFRRPSPFWHRHLDPDERRRVMHDLALVQRTHWTFRFTTMLGLSVLVAVMGLAADSAAVVIGAMLLAPLMTPVLGTAAAMAMALPRKTAVSATRVVLASIGCVALSWLAAKLALNDAAPLAGEIEARTRPDLRDLVVALAAGAAGSYATVRSDTSSSLPGVAVAVALVPPLATVGITLEAGNTVWARGALLLYITNLVAIVFVSIVVFLLTGFVPPRRVERTVPGILLALSIAVVAVAIISVPLLRASQGAADAARTEQSARQAIDDWLGDLPLDLAALDLDGNPVVVELSGSVSPPATESLETALATVLGEGVQVAVLLDEKQAPTTTTIRIATDEEIRASRTQEVVDTWLAENDDGNQYVLESFSLVDTDLRLIVSGLGEKPPLLDLIDRLAIAAPDDPIVPSVRWSQLEEVPVGEEPPTPLEVAAARLDELVAVWAAEGNLVVVGTDYDGTRLIVDVEGAAPAPIEPLLEAVAASDEADTTVEVFFRQRVRLETTTTTLPPELLPSFPGATTTTTVGSTTTGG